MFDGPNTLGSVLGLLSAIAGLAQASTVTWQEPTHEKLDAHINRLWAFLPEQSRRRLGCIAVSAGSDVTPENHALLIATLSQIAEAEGTLEQEREFCETYLQVPWVCAAVAAAERRRAKPGKKKAAARREQVRLAVARYRERQKEEEGKAGQRAARAARDALQARLETVRKQRVIAVDGEGVTLPDGSHAYQYMAARRSDGVLLGELWADEGIGTAEAVRFLTSLPKKDEDGIPYLGVFGFGLGYDTAKWLEDLKNKPLYELTHSEDLRPKAKVFGVKLSIIGKCLELTERRAAPGERRTKVWDLLRGFQSSFVKALEDWGVGTAEQRTRIAAMKKKRGDFAREEPAKVRGYCQEECQLLARLVEDYVEAHIDAGIDLAGKFHGAGSTGDAFLKLMNALDKKCTRESSAKDLDAFQQLTEAFSRAFFGGRAEVSRLGRVMGPCWTADIASAYPWVLYELPCVRHGKWGAVSARGLDRALKGSRLGCVHYALDAMPGDAWEVGSKARPEALPEPGDPVMVGAVPVSRKRGKKWDRTLAERLRTYQERANAMKVAGEPSSLPWGPLPYRTGKGSIVFPSAHPGGWAWRAEYEAARRHHGGVRALGGWVLRSRCQCERPYQAIGGYYLQRLRWGASGRGKVLKLACNSCYGKISQVIGSNPKYACRAVAGHITATTRARLYEGAMSARDERNVIYAATDGLIATEELRPPNPAENETTKEAPKIAPDKGWLGQWEVERIEWKDGAGKHPDSVFIVQPGWWFGLSAVGKAKTRGTPLDVIYPLRSSIIEQWERDPTSPPRGLPKQPTFHGIKSSILPPSTKEPRYRRLECYGRWTDEERRLGYVVNPKRADLYDRGDGSFGLLTWRLNGDNPESAVYKKDADAEVKRLDLLNDEQPDFVGGPLGMGVGNE